MKGVDAFCAERFDLLNRHVGGDQLTCRWVVIQAFKHGFESGRDLRAARACKTKQCLEVGDREDAGNQVHGHGARDRIAEAQKSVVIEKELRDCMSCPRFDFSFQVVEIKGG